MNFITDLKTVSKEIIELSSKLNKKVHTWNDETSAPNGGFTDRAGFVSADEQFDLCVDVYYDDSKSLLRTRLGKINKDENGGELFTLITLDYEVELLSVKAIIDTAQAPTKEMFISLLSNPTTAPSHIHVSLASGINDDGNPLGRRYEFYEETLQNISVVEQQEFVATLQNAYDAIAAHLR